MRKTSFLYALSFVLLGCDNATEKTEVTSPVIKAVSEPASIAILEVSNPSEFARPDSMIRLSLRELGVSEGPLQVWEGATPRLTQLVDNDGDNKPDDLVFLTGLEPAATQSYKIDQQVEERNWNSRVHAEISIKEGGEWQDNMYVGGTFKNVSHMTNPPQHVPHSEYIRYEGPGIESDWVGYRVYLDERNGFDIFGKQKPELALQNVGQMDSGSYHEMADWGADILKVGESLGMGGYGFWDGSKTVFVSDVTERSVTVRSDGPILAALDINYKDWNTGSEVVDLNASLSMRAGSPMVDVKLETSDPLENFAIGIVAHPGTELIIGELDDSDEAWAYMASFGKQTLFDDNLGMVVMYLKKDLIEHTRDESSYVAVMKPRGKTFSYAFGALWSGQHNGVQTKDELEAFLLAELERRTLAPRLRIQQK